MNTEYTCRMNNKWDRFAGFHARTTANGFSRFNAAVGNDLEHAVAENNHLIVATTQWYPLVEPDDGKSSISASIILYITNSSSSSLSWLSFYGIIVSSFALLMRKETFLVANSAHRRLEFPFCSNHRLPPYTRRTFTISFKQITLLQI